MGRAAYGSRIAALLLFAAALAAACGGSGNSPTRSPTPTSAPSPAPTTVPTPEPPDPPPQSDEPPERDLVDLARRFRGLPSDTPLTTRASPFDYQPGDREEFMVLELSGPSLRTASASVRLVTDHAYFFVEDGVSVSASALERVGSDFEALVYPRVTAAFGRVLSPGIDGDERITILHADLSGAGGYVYSSDAFPLSVAPGSNEREAIYLDSSFLASPAEYNAVLAHELQHLIHQDADDGEEAWVNEGLSQVAAELAGGGVASTGSFLALPDTQLNHWPQGGGLHYGKSQLFFRYLLDQYGGRENAAALLAIPEDGIDGVDTYLEQFGTSFEEVFADWIIANYLDEGSGRYAHEGADLTVSSVDRINGTGEGEESVNQYAADYLEIDPPDDGAIFTFDGSDEVGTGVAPRDGAFWWSTTGDSIDSRLTRSFDLTGLDAATLRFQVWFDAELGWDYGYVAVSEDGGKTWTALPGNQTSGFDPVELAYGPGYTGDSGGEWLQEEVDLTPYAGGEVLVRFEYVADDSTHGRGFAVDDIEVPELGFFDGADAGGEWLAEGFRRIEGPLEQRFLVQIVERGEPNPPEAEHLELGAGNRLEVALDGPATIVVAAATEGTTEAAAYRWTLRAR